MNLFVVVSINWKSVLPSMFMSRPHITIWKVKEIHTDHKPQMHCRGRGSSWKVILSTMSSLYLRKPDIVEQPANSMMCCRFSTACMYSSMNSALSSWNKHHSFAADLSKAKYLQGSLHRHVFVSNCVYPLLCICNVGLGLRKHVLSNEITFVMKHMWTNYLKINSHHTGNL